MNSYIRHKHSHPRCPTSHRVARDCLGMASRALDVLPRGSGPLVRRRAMVVGAICALVIGLIASTAVYTPAHAATGFTVRASAFAFSGPDFQVADTGVLEQTSTSIQVNAVDPYLPGSAHGGASVHMGNASASGSVSGGIEGNADGTFTDTATVTSASLPDGTLVLVEFTAVPGLSFIWQSEDHVVGTASAHLGGCRVVLRACQQIIPAIRPPLHPAGQPAAPRE